MTTTERPAAAAEAGGTDSVILSSAARGKIFLYLGLLIVLLSFGDPNGGLIDIPVSFFLKNKLHLQSHELANFRLVAAIPLYFAWAIGFVRDTWNPLGMRDRGFMVIFGAVSACFYVCFAFVPVSYTSLLVALIVMTTSFLFIASAQNGLASTLGRQHAMSGQISAVVNIFGSLPAVAALLIGGHLSDRLEAQDADRAIQILFLVGAAIAVLVTIYGAWKPKSVFDHVHAERSPVARPLDDIRRLFRHRPIYPALTIWLLWNFAPGSSTPLQYYLQNSLHADDSQWGAWNAIFAASFIPSFLVFGVLCRRVPLKHLLFWGTMIAIPQFVPLLFVHSINGALMAAVPIGLMGGVATAAYLDLIIRSCPTGLEGTTLMMSGALYFVASRFGDVLGTNIYDRYNGFSVCVAMISIVYAAIVPVLLLVPQDLTALADGQTSGAETGDEGGRAG